MTAMTMPSVAKMRRMSRARAPTHRSIPISRVRSSTPIVIALTRPTMLIATITSPSTVIVVVMFAFWATLSAFWSYQAIVVIGVPGSEGVLEPRGQPVDVGVVSGVAADPVGVDLAGRAEHLLQGRERHVELPGCPGSHSSPTMRRRAGPAAVCAVTVSPTCAPVAAARPVPTTATAVPRAASAAVYQRPRDPQAHPRLVGHAPEPGVLARDLGPVGEHRLDRRDAGRRCQRAPRPRR